MQMQMQMLSPFAKMAFVSVESEYESENIDSIQNIQNIEHYAWLNRLHRAAHVAKVLRHRVVLERTTSTSFSKSSNSQMEPAPSSPPDYTNALIRKKLVYPVRFNL